MLPLVAYVDLQRFILALSKSDGAVLAKELKHLRLEYSLVIATEVIAALLAGKVEAGPFDLRRFTVVCPNAVGLLLSLFSGQVRRMQIAGLKQ